MAAAARISRLDSGLGGLTLGATLAGDGWSLRGAADVDLDSTGFFTGGLSARLSGSLADRRLAVRDHRGAADRVGIDDAIEAVDVAHQLGRDDVGAARSCVAMRPSFITTTRSP